MDENRENGDGDGKIWDGYSDYRTISSRIGTSIFDAMDAYSRVHSAHVEGARVRPPEAAEARARILTAAIALKAEMGHQKENNDDVSTILDRWESGEGGDDVPVSVPQAGFLDAFRGIRLTDQCPDWLYQFVVDFWRAGWELGYLKAGRHEEQGWRELDPADVPEMLTGSGD